MEWVETTGRSLDEAKELALDQLGIDEDEAEFEIISEPKFGLLARFRSEARVRARIKPSKPRSKEESNRRRRRPGGDSATSFKQAGKITPSQPLKEEGVQEKTVSKRDDYADRQQPQGDSQMDDEVSLEEQSDIAVDFLKNLFSEIQLEISIDVSINEDEQVILVSVKGEDLGFLIGQRGLTLHSIQELTRTVVKRKTGARIGRILLDIGGWREKRKVALERFCLEITQQVKDTGVPITLEPMNSSDRKIVHDVVNSIEGLSTKSKGDDPRRFVVIQLADTQID